ncbi:uncharacterized protein LOC125662207 isoform X6 [Ostrea edulis]|uniref:uncharacterized protein LOC125662207 isoform X6 n=1 Tax=Ostrea edulis TaxID=37623 RepID=UPI0024AF5BA5|nr:uncharacterized protein LOC125662207 isoform X6 [Ostrea edulis]
MVMNGYMVRQSDLLVLDDVGIDVRNEPSSIADKASSTSSPDFESSTEGNSLRDDVGIDVRNEPSSIADKASSTSSPDFESSTKGNILRDDMGIDVRNEPSSIADKASSTSSPDFESSIKGNSLRDDVGIDVRNEPSSIADKASSTSSPDFESSTKGNILRDDIGIDVRNEPSSIADKASSTSSPDFKSSIKGNSLRDDMGIDVRNEPSSIADKASSTSSPDFESSIKGNSLRDEDGIDVRNEPSSIADKASFSSSPDFESSTKGNSLRDDDGIDVRNEPSSIADKASSTSSPDFESSIKGNILRDDVGIDVRNEPSSIADKASSTSSPDFESSIKGNSLRDDDGIDVRNEPSSIADKASSTSSPDFESSIKGNILRDDVGIDVRNEPSSIADKASSSSSPGFESSTNENSLREPEVTDVSEIESFDDTDNELDFSFESRTKGKSFIEPEVTDVSETESFDDNDDDPDFSLESDCVSNSSDISDVIPLNENSAFSLKKQTSTGVKRRYNKQTTVYTSNQEVTTTTDGTSTKKAKITSNQEVTSTTDGALNKKAKITIQKSNNEKGRKWDKKEYCLFCEKSSTNIRKHYLKSHKTETEVQKIMRLPLRSKNRTAEITRLRNAGNYKHNVSVLKKESGELVVVARQSNDSKPEDYLPCDECLGFFLKEGLWRHKQVCKLRTGKQKSRRVQADAALLLPASNSIHAGLKEKVFGKMVRDEVTIAARNDAIILKVGEKLYQKHGHLTHLYSHISQKMRELGRFLICAKTQDLSINCLNDIIDPEKFPLAVKSTKVLCEFNEVTNTYKNPSLALKLGHLLKKCAKVAKSEALINGDVEGGSRADNFLTLCENEWTDEISSSALQTLTRNKMNKGYLLPLSEDIIRLNKFLDQKTESLLETLHNRFDRAEWELLNQMTLAQLVLFNRRRGGETQRLLVGAYCLRTQNKDCPQEVMEALSATERILLDTLSRVEIRGKRGRTVPVLLTQKAKRCIELLLRWRDTAGVAKENKYVFPRPNYGSLEALRSADVLRTFSKAAGLTNPEMITSTRLRKHVATVAQVLSLNKNDLEIMATFMGHDITVHRSFYRLPQETLQVAKMGRLLTALNNGSIGQYSGKSLEEIPLDETAELSSEEEMDENDNQEDQEDEVQGIQNPESSDMDNLTVAKPSATVTSSRQPSTTVTSSRQPKCVQKLSEEQSQLLKSLFKTNIALRKELRCEDCEKVIKKYEVLSRLSWKKIKNTIHNWITSEKKKTKKLI